MYNGGSGEEEGDKLSPGYCYSLPRPPVQCTRCHQARQTRPHPPALPLPPPTILLQMLFLFLPSPHLTSSFSPFSFSFSRLLFLFLLSLNFLLLYLCTCMIPPSQITFLPFLLLLFPILLLLPLSTFSFSQFTFPFFPHLPFPFPCIYSSIFHFISSVPTSSFSHFLSLVSRSFFSHCSSPVGTFFSFFHLRLLYLLPPSILYCNSTLPPFPSQFTKFIFYTPSTPSSFYFIQALPSISTFSLL